MSRLLVTSILIVGLLAARASPAPRSKDEPPPDYLPAAVGTRWVYDCGGAEQVMLVTDVEERGGAKVVTVKQSSRAGWVPAERVAITPRGLLQIEFAGAAVEPYCKLKFPVKAGDAWDFEVPRRVGVVPGWSGTTTDIREEEVKVPAGTFKAVKVEQLIKTEYGKPLAKPEKYVAGIGRVKMTHSEGCNLELKSFSPGTR